MLISAYFVTTTFESKKDPFLNSSLAILASACLRGLLPFLPRFTWTRLEVEILRITSGWAQNIFVRDAALELALC